MTTVHIDNQGDNPGPPHPSARLPADIVGYHLTQLPSALLSLRDPINPAYANT
jgi:hypothetical protein